MDSAKIAITGVLRITESHCITVVVSSVSDKVETREKLHRQCLGFIGSSFSKKGTGSGAVSGRICSLHDTSVQSCFGLVDKVYGFVKTHVADLVSPFRNCRVTKFLSCDRAESR